MKKETRKTRNPLYKRIFRELKEEWRKYLVVTLFLSLTIGCVSGVFIANQSMLTSVQRNANLYKREDGHFVLEKQASPAMLEELESGKKADLHAYILDQAKDEFDERFDAEFKEEFEPEFEKEFRTAIAQQIQAVTGRKPSLAAVDQMIEQAKKNGQAQSAYDQAWKEAYTPAKDKAWEEVEKEVEDEYQKTVEDYDLNNPDFQVRPVTITENFFRNESEIDPGNEEGTIRVYPLNDSINTACLMEGKLPADADEIAIDRMHADNRSIQVGDSIKVGSQTYTVSGLIARPDYTSLFEKSTEFMFDALNFDVGLLTEEGFNQLASPVHYNYGWTYQTRPKNNEQAKRWSDDFLVSLVMQSVIHEDDIEDYVPAYQNPAITFAPEDMESDRSMAVMILCILVVIIGFIFAITTSSGIEKEARTIGTLRASGFSRCELVLHSLASPLLVTIFAAVLGNLLGYTVFKDAIYSLYYNSYSLPVSETLWNPEAFWITTVLPLILIFIINVVIVWRVMNHSIQSFLRQDLHHSRRKKTMHLSKGSFFSRFRMRILLQNLSSYLVLAFGVLFVMVLLALVIGMPDTLDWYQKNAKDQIPAPYQTFIKTTENLDLKKIEKDYPDAETFTARTLNMPVSAVNESITVYGLQPDSSYIGDSQIKNLTGNKVLVSEAMGQKYDLVNGKTLTLKEPYTSETYSFEIAGMLENNMSMSVYMPQKEFQAFFDLDQNKISGWFSSEEMKSLDSDEIAAVLTARDYTKMADQLDHSMGGMMDYFQIVCLLLAMALLYLLSKLIIEKNQKSISMIKILGYEDKEIASLYVVSTAIVVIASAAIGTWLGTQIMSAIWKQMLQNYSGWFVFHMELMSYLKMFVIVTLAYLFVVWFDFRRVQKIPKAEALKNVE